MAQVHKVIIMLLNSHPDLPSSLGSPFFQATVAAVMDLEVEVYFAGRAARLLRKGVAEKLFPGEGQEKSLYAFMQDAHEAGAKFYVCGGAATEYGIDPETVIPEFDGARGGTAFIGAVIEPGVVTLTY